jgi:hypothetical protein
MDVFSRLACCDLGGRHKSDAEAPIYVHHCIGGHDVDIGRNLLHQRRTTLGWLKKDWVVLWDIIEGSNNLFE